MQLAPRDLSGAWNFNLTHLFLEYFYTSAQGIGQVRNAYVIPFVDVFLVVFYNNY
jgi:Na+/melibiose symporter-like transporter